VVLKPWPICVRGRSCRTRLESHKIRQREHHSRRMARAAAAVQRQAAAAVNAVCPSPLPAAAPGVLQPAVSGGQTFVGMPTQMGQLLPSEGTHPHAPSYWGPLQRPAPWQQAKQATDSLLPQRHAMHVSPAAQQPQQPPHSAAASGGAPSIFADMPQDELPLAMHVGRQVISCTHARLLPIHHHLESALRLRLFGVPQVEITTAAHNIKSELPAASTC
jgi:hypothetical protein